MACIGAAGKQHRVLARQLKKLGLDPERPPPNAAAWRQFLERISRAYQDADQDRYLLERSLAISSGEMQELYESLRQASESRLRAEGNKLRAVISAVGAGLCTLDLEGRVLSINPEGQRLLGCTEEDLLGTCFFERVEASWNQPDSVDCTDTRITTLVAEGQPHHAPNASFARKDGVVFPVAYTLNPIMDEGTLRGAVLVFFDLTERKRAEEALRESEQRFRDLFESSPDAIFVEDFEGNVLDVNPAACELHGLARENLLGRNVADLVPVEQRATLAREFARLVEGDVKRLEGYSRNLNGRVIPVEIRVNHIVYARQPALLLHVCDISERKRVETELIEAREKAEEMSHLKSAFLNNMSHEIRTPLTAIIGFSAILSEETTPEHRELVDLIEQSGKRLLNTLNAVLDLSMLETGSLHVENEWFDLAELAHEKVMGMQPLAREKHISLDLTVPASRMPVYLDRACLDRILTHLIDNAIKFTHEGAVTVALVREAGRVHLRVEDTGVGIGEAFRPHLFDDFKQESTGLARSHEGAGLGLAVTRRMVTLMDGDITVESEKGQGSVFAVSFAQPASMNGKAKALCHRDAGQHRPCILVVEDTPEIELLVEYMLSDSYVVMTTPHEEGALALARRQRFDLVLMDINLGSTRTGVDVMNSLRRLPGYEAVPIVAMTAYALLEDRTRFLEAGFDGYLSKPFTAYQAIDTIRQLLPPGRNAPA